MPDPLIPGGYILLSRKIVESEIWDKPPLYIKVWIYLLTKAQHRQYKNLERGCLLTSIPEIQQACSWKIGCRKVTPTKDQVYQVLEWLRNPLPKMEAIPESNDESNTKATMIATTKATHGMFIRVENFNVYQNPKSYESNDESNDEKAMKATTNENLPYNKNDNKNDKNDNKKKDIYVLSEDEKQFLETLSRIENYPIDRKKDLEMYHSLQERYPALDILDAIEQWRMYKLDKPLQKNSNPRSQINTAFRKYTEWGKCSKKEPGKTIKFGFKGSERRI